MSTTTNDGFTGTLSGGGWDQFADRYAEHERQYARDRKRFTAEAEAARGGVIPADIDLNNPPTSDPRLTSEQILRLHEDAAAAKPATKSKPAVKSS